MRYLVRGLCGSGKSKFAEELLMTKGCPVIYVGTLPVEPCTLDKIQIHQSRRDERWELVQIEGNLQRDSKLMESVMNNSKPVLIDGLWIWFARYSRAYGDESSGPQALAQLVWKLLRSRQRDWVIVDPSPATFVRRGKHDLSSIVMAQHDDLISHCGATLIEF